jgi:hypothetical protein
VHGEVLLGYLGEFVADLEQRLLGDARVRVGKRAVALEELCLKKIN